MLACSPAVPCLTACSCSYSREFVFGPFAMVPCGSTLAVRLRLLSSTPSGTFIPIEPVPARHTSGDSSDSVTALHDAGAIPGRSVIAVYAEVCHVPASFHRMIMARKVTQISNTRSPDFPAFGIRQVLECGDGEKRNRRLCAWQVEALSG